MTKFSDNFLKKNILHFILWFHFFCYIKTNNSLLYPGAVRSNYGFLHFLMKIIW